MRKPTYVQTKSVILNIVIKCTWIIQYVSFNRILQKPYNSEYRQNQSYEFIWKGLNLKAF